MLLSNKNNPMFSQKVGLDIQIYLHAEWTLSDSVTYLENEFDEEVTISRRGNDRRKSGFGLRKECINLLLLGTQLLQSSNVEGIRVDAAQTKCQEDLRL
jgi:hypothetical protein